MRNDQVALENSLDVLNKRKRFLQSERQRATYGKRNVSTGILNATIAETIADINRINALLGF